MESALRQKICYEVGGLSIEIDVQERHRSCWMSDGVRSKIHRTLSPSTPSPLVPEKSTITIAIKVSSSTTSIFRSESGFGSRHRPAGGPRRWVTPDGCTPRSRGVSSWLCRPPTVSMPQSSNSESRRILACLAGPAMQRPIWRNLHFQLQDHLRGRTELLIWPSILLDRPLKQAEPSHLSPASDPLMRSGNWLPMYLRTIGFCR